MKWRNSLSLKLALMFALVSTCLLGGIGFYLNYSLQRELVWRDDQSLLGRLEHIEALLSESDSVTELRSRPQLYANMLGNQDSLLWVLDDSGTALISVNPGQLPLPRLSQSEYSQLGFDDDKQARLAWRYVDHDGQSLLLIAGKLLAPREQMLAAYRLKLLLTLAVGALLAFVLGGWVSRRALQPLRALGRKAESIDVRRLHVRLHKADLPQELQGLQRSLNQMLARLEAGFAQLSRFSEDLAHEVRTPLNNLMVQTEHTLRKPRPLEEYEGLLASHQEEYERLSRMVDSILFLARTEQPQASLNQSWVNLSELTEQLCEYFEGMAEEAQMALINEVHLTSAQGVDAKQALTLVWADKDLLRRALANLLSNALRYGAKGQPIRLSSYHQSGETVLQVSNQGPVITDPQLALLFERFYRCDPSRANPGQTGGLGLSIVRSIMQLHQGRAWVESDHQGVRFMLAFPDQESLVV
ncbi:two-component sensor histidine kinase [Oceanisphaera profunda]|uniref:Sensor protein n=1 Tax=Oceanisphaera profunda TaxID=1416627 RepID=A0A1Y0D765_9GAMM|nr:heavy metal sensor histidine kinase [Oceanisphaera profunda]ART83016.1 two-component sensor histidine kinase [Oceanisphaera profunda]